MNTNDIWLIAGLGNPEAKYDGTRHNAGFAALDYLSGKWGISVSKTKFQGLWGQGEVDGHKVVLLKPLTYMNLSGDSIAPLAGFFKIPADHVIVLCDASPRTPANCAPARLLRNDRTTVWAAATRSRSAMRRPTGTSIWSCCTATTRALLRTCCRF